MVNLIDFDKQWIDNVMMNQFEILMTKPMFYIAFSASKEIISNNDLMALHHQIVDQMGSNEASTASYLGGEKYAIKIMLNRD